MDPVKELLTSDPEALFVVGSVNRAALVERAIQIMEEGPEQHGLSTEQFDEIKRVWLQNRQRRVEP